MKGKTRAELAAKRLITNKNISTRQYLFEHKGLENLNNGKIIREKRRFSTTC